MTLYSRQITIRQINTNCTNVCTVLLIKLVFSSILPRFALFGVSTKVSIQKYLSNNCSYQTTNFIEDISYNFF